PAARQLPTRGQRSRLRLRDGVHLHGTGPLRVGRVVAVTGVLAGLHRQHRAARAQQLASLGADAGAAHRLLLRLELGVLAAGERDDLLRDAHAAPVVAAHRTELGIDLEVLVVQRARSLAVERQLELLRPVERRARARDVVVPLARARDAAGDV